MELYARPCYPCAYELIRLGNRVDHELRIGRSRGSMQNAMRPKRHSGKESFSLWAYTFKNDYAPQYASRPSLIEFLKKVTYALGCEADI